jgi:hypothetical protein
MKLGHIIGRAHHSGLAVWGMNSLILRPRNATDSSPWTLATKKKEDGCCITTTHRLTLPFSAGSFFFTQYNMTVDTRLTCPSKTFLFPRLYGYHFDTVKVTETESQRCWTPSQNTNSMMHLKMAEGLGTAHALGRVPLRGWRWPVSPKLVFNKLAAQFPGIMDRCDFRMFLNDTVCRMPKQRGIMRKEY